MDENKRNSLAQDKVLILYTLHKLNREITESDLFKFVSPINEINYFYFKQILTDLVESKLVETYTKEEDDDDDDKKQSIYKISADGKNSLDLTIDILPGIKKLKADTILKNELSSITQENSIVTEFVPENEQSYTVKCKIIENNKNIFEIRAFAGSIEQARLISDNWKNNAYTIYPQILSLITEKNN